MYRLLSLILVLVSFVLTAVNVAHAESTSASTRRSSHKKTEQWNWMMGWNRLVPSRSTLADAENRLGGKSKILGEDGLVLTYHFDKGVNVKIDKSTNMIDEIDVDASTASEPDMPPFPQTKTEFDQTYGRSYGVTPVYSDDKPPRLTELKFTYLKIVEESHRYCKFGSR